MLPIEGNQRVHGIFLYYYFSQWQLDLQLSQNKEFNF